MTRTFKPLIALTILAACAFAQTPVPVPGVDYLSPIPVPFIGFTKGYSAPTLCVPGMSPLFFNLGNATFYSCSARNTWTAMGALGATTPSGSGKDLGSTSAPWRVLYLYGAGTYGSNNFHVTGTPTGARTITLPDASITVSGATAQYCGATATCGATSMSSTLKIVQGSGTLNTGSPSTFAVTAISPAFTSASTYTCVAQDTATIATNIGVLVAGYVSGSAVTFTGPNTNTDTFKYTCTGY